MPDVSNSSGGSNESPGLRIWVSALVEFRVYGLGGYVFAMKGLGVSNKSLFTSC